MLSFLSLFANIEMLKGSVVEGDDKRGGEEMTGAFFNECHRLQRCLNCYKYIEEGGEGFEISRIFQNSDKKVYKQP